MSQGANEYERQEVICHEIVDPIARRIVEADDPWTAYRDAVEAAGLVLDQHEWMPDAGEIYVQWMELSDLFDHPNSLLGPDLAYARLRRAASDWLESPVEIGALKRWAEGSDYFAGAYPKKRWWRRLR